MIEHNKIIPILNRTTLVYQLDWEDEPRESLRMRCLEYERKNNEGNWVLYILPNLEELDSGWWRLYEINSSRIGKEWRVDTKIAMKWIRGTLVPVANQLGVTLNESEKLEKVCIQDLVERVAKKVDSREERYEIDTSKKMFPPKEIIKVDIYQKPDGTIIHLREDPAPFNEENRKTWAEHFNQFKNLKEEDDRFKGK